MNKKPRLVLVSVNGSKPKCSVCGGNDKDMPCAFPGGKQPGCLRDARMQKPPMSVEERQKAALRAILGAVGMALGEVEHVDEFDEVLERIAQIARAGLVTPKKTN